MADAPGTTWLDGSSRGSVADWGSAAAAVHTCCVGEAVGLDVELRNPLQIDLKLTRLRLACTFEPSCSGIITEAAMAPHNGDSTRGQVCTANGQQQQQQHENGPDFQVWEESITLRAGERMIVHLRVVPLRPGRLEVGGLAWMLDGVAQGLRRFCIPQPKPRQPSTSHKMLDAERPPPGGVVLTVLPLMPRLEATVEGLEPTLLAGELVQASLRLRNAGSMALQGLAMATASPGIYVDNGGNMSSSGTSDPTDCSSPAAVNEPALAEVTFRQRQGVAIFSLPRLRLAVGQELTLPIWFRCVLSLCLCGGGTSGGSGSGHVDTMCMPSIRPLTCCFSPLWQAWPAWPHAL